MTVCPNFNVPPANYVEHTKVSYDIAVELVLPTVAKLFRFKPTLLLCLEHKTVCVQKRERSASFPGFIAS
jgi:hypothetical protein